MEISVMTICPSFHPLVVLTGDPRLRRGGTGLWQRKGRSGGWRWREEDRLRLCFNPQSPGGAGGSRWTNPQKVQAERRRSPSGRHGDERLRTSQRRTRPASLSTVLFLFLISATTFLCPTVKRWLVLTAEVWAGVLLSKCKKSVIFVKTWKTRTKMFFLSCQIAVLILTSLFLFLPPFCFTQNIQYFHWIAVRFY